MFVLDFFQKSSDICGLSLVTVKGFLPNVRLLVDFSRCDVSPQTLQFFL